MKGNAGRLDGLIIPAERQVGGSPRIRRVSLIVVLLIAFLCAAVVPPFVFLAYSSLHQLDPTGAFGVLTFEHFSAIFRSRALGLTLVNSVAYALGSALLALAIGVDPSLARGTNGRLPAAASLRGVDRVARYPLRPLYRGLASFPG